MAKKTEDQFSKKEADRRFKSALLGSRKAGPKPMDDLDLQKLAEQIGQSDPNVDFGSDAWKRRTRRK